MTFVFAVDMSQVSIDGGKMSYYDAVGDKRTVVFHSWLDAKTVRFMNGVSTGTGTPNTVNYDGTDANFESLTGEKVTAFSDYPVT